MNDTTPAKTRIVFSMPALKALGEMPDMRAGPLSPLARITPPDAPSARAALVEALAPLSGPLAFSIPALLDPQLSVAVLFGDGDTALVGQYLWADPDARTPGFLVDVGRDEVRLSGPLDDNEVLLTCLDLAAINGVSETDLLRMSFSLEQFWATLTLLDAYRMAQLRRRLSRQGGCPAGVSEKGLAEAWLAGLAVNDPGWSVSLFALLRPDLVPENFETRVVGVVDQLDKDGLLAILAGEDGDSLGDVYILGEGLELLCQAVMRGVVQIGLAVQRVRAVGEIETTVIGGWRTLGGFWLADLSSIPTGGDGTVEVSLLGPRYVAALLENVLGGATQGDAQVDDGGFMMPEGYSRDAVLSALHAMPVVSG
jgi:hypothetical protein